MSKKIEMTVKEKKARDEIRRLQKIIEAEEKARKQKEARLRDARIREKGATIEFLLGNDTIEEFEKKLMLIRTLLIEHYPEIFGNDLLAERIRHLDSQKSRTKKATEIFMSIIDQINSEKTNGKVQVTRKDLFMTKEEKEREEELKKALQVSTNKEELKDEILSIKEAEKEKQLAHRKQQQNEKTKEEYIQKENESKQPDFVEKKHIESSNSNKKITLEEFEVAKRQTPVTENEKGDD